MNSLWYFEKESELDEYKLPKHKSNNYIDIDFERNLLFLKNKEYQQGIEKLMRTEDENTLSKQKLIKDMKLKIPFDTEQIIRVCFDFENCLIMLKNAKGTENNIYYDNLKRHRNTILNCIDLETIEDLDIELETYMMFNHLK